MADFPTIDDEPAGASALTRALFDAGAPAAPAPALPLDAALAARPAGAWIGFTDDDAITPVEAYRREADRFEGLLTSLSDEQWRLPVRTYGDTTRLVAHLSAIEHYVGAQLGLWASALDPSDDHIAIGRQFIADRTSTAPADLVREWRGLVAEVIDAVGDDPQRLSLPASWHGAPVDFAGLLLIRTFELWTHGDDVRRALGHRLAAPDNAQLRLMTNLAAAVLPLGLAIIERSRAGHTLRLVLTGAGGGTWRVGLAPGDAARDHDDLVIVADTLDFCRLAANRLTADELVSYVEGDAALAADVFTGMAALAVD